MMCSTLRRIDRLKSEKFYWLLGDVVVQQVALGYAERDKLSAQLMGSTMKTQQGVMQRRTLAA